MRLLAMAWDDASWANDLQTTPVLVSASSGIKQTGLVSRVD
jgi:hypothetical protein